MKGWLVLNKYNILIVAQAVKHSLSLKTEFRCGWSGWWCSSVLKIRLKLQVDKSACPSFD